MRKKIIITIIICLAFNMMCFSAANSFIEMVAGKINVKGENVGVITVSPLSFLYQVGGKSIKMKDDPISNALKYELINKGAKVMILDPSGMEQVLSEFVAIRKGKFSTKEVLTASADKALISGMKNTKADISAGINLIDKLLNINELSGESGRIDNYSILYKKVIDLWNISKLITVERKGAFGVIVKGYEINGASAGLVFQYEVRADKDTWANSFPVKFDDNWEKNGYTVIDDPELKYEQSYKRVLELTKRVSEFLK